MAKSSSAYQCRAVSIYTTAAFIYIVVFFHRLVAASTTKEFQGRFNLTESELSHALGVFSSLYFYFYSFLQPFVGITVDAIKPRWTIFIAGVLMSIGSLIIGLTTNLNVAYVGRSLIGIGAAFVYVPILKLIALWFPIRKFGLLTGIMVALGGLGGFLCTAPLSIAIEALAKVVENPNRLFGDVFSSVSGLSALLTIIFVCITTDTPEKAGYPPITESPAVPETNSRPLATSEVQDSAAERTSTVMSTTVIMPEYGHDFHYSMGPSTCEAPEEKIQDAPIANSSSQTKPNRLKEFRRSLAVVFCGHNSKYLIIMMLAYFFCVGSYFTFSASIGVDLITKTVPSNTSLKITTKMQAVWIQAGLNLSTVAGSPLQSFMATLIGRKPMQLINATVMFFVYLGIALTKQLSPAIWSYTILYVLLGFIGGTMIVVSYMNVKEMFPIDVAGTVIGVFNVAPFLGAAVFQNIAPLLINVKGTGVEYENVCYLMMANTVIAFIFILFSKETKEANPKQKS